jgi:hypothetical protein
MHPIPPEMFLLNGMREIQVEYRGSIANDSKSEHLQVANTVRQYDFCRTFYLLNSSITLDILQATLIAQGGIKGSGA